MLTLACNSMDLNNSGAHVPDCGKREQRGGRSIGPTLFLTRSPPLVVVAAAWTVDACIASRMQRESTYAKQWGQRRWRRVCGSCSGGVHHHAPPLVHRSSIVVVLELFALAFFSAARVGANRNRPFSQAVDCQPPV
jgi:hypothetical protein